MYQYFVTHESNQKHFQIYTQNVNENCDKQAKKPN